MSRAWKDAEREVAKFFGLQRRVRVSYSESVGDTTQHDILTIEVKYGKQVPKLLDVDSPCFLRLQDSGRVFKLVPSQMWSDRDRLTYEPVMRKEQVFLTDAISQAASYNPSKVPVVCVKRPRRKGFVIIWEVVHVSDPS